MYIETIIKRFDIENFKKGFILMIHGVLTSKEYFLKTLKDSIDGKG